MSSPSGVAGTLGSLAGGILGASQTAQDLQQTANTAATYAATWGVIVAIELFIIILLLAKKRG